MMQVARFAAVTSLLWLLGGCLQTPPKAPEAPAPKPAAAEPPPPVQVAQPETIPEPAMRMDDAWVLTQDHRLVQIAGDLPGKAVTTVRLVGFDATDELVGIDYRVARGELFALSKRGVLYKVDTNSGRLTAVGPKPADPKRPSGIEFKGGRFAFDFNPTADRIRVISDAGQSLRLHPDTGQAVDADPQEPGVQADSSPAFAAGDINEGRSTEVVAVAYTYNKTDDKLTTGFAIERRRGVLVTLGSAEGRVPVVSANTGKLFTVGSLGQGELDDASMDIADRSGRAFAALRPADSKETAWFRINLRTGRTERVGLLLDGRPVRGFALIP